ncbi:hypothetical protein D9M68_942500 [compost metagenome]
MQHCTAAGGQHQAIQFAEIGNYRPLALAKALLTLDIEDPRNIGTAALLDLLVGVLEQQPQLFGKQTPDGAFTSAHRANKNYITHRVNGSQQWPGCS